MGSKEEQKRIRQELKDLAPGLAQLKTNEKPPDIPAHYYEQLPDQIFQRIREAQAESVPRLERGLPQQFLQQIRLIFSQPAYAMAFAGLAVVIIALAVLLRDETGGSVDATALSEEDIIQYIDYHIDEFDLGLLMEGADPEPFEEEFLPGEDSLEESDLEDYLEELLDEVL